VIAALTGADIGLILSGIGAAGTVAALLANSRRHQIDKESAANDAKRKKWRSDDAIKGWVDEHDRWHPGVIDTVQGWDDDEGVHHPGNTEAIITLDQAVAEHKTILDQHGQAVVRDSKRIDSLRRDLNKHIAASDHKRPRSQ
jgi:hypothetical protein